METRVRGCHIKYNQDGKQEEGIGGSVLSNKKLEGQ